MKYYNDPQWVLDEIKLIRSIVSGPTSAEDEPGYSKGTNRAVAILLESVIDALEDKKSDAEKFADEPRKVTGR